ncbi:hypothetical protein G7B40_028260 [Aetokthonos hydrillicola Thurmond2011]|jgi:hypothetical protein|uniref:Uncharacterized protein n=1 Tax=Aetokthonos hydrillicola Thurmond2011 TaxID=2712845 RepID=A0AAP5IG38_9CYAN|nr:hypothetical protein [Aetokthonos hydrillicola]MBW4589855.1 hypothetical protein [Aetokthonos hydrillicola CCALA 1050]MDR9898425.1 hypothetical protein [Aetokthonos hydrillicola Thurmond2011]
MSISLQYPALFILLLASLLGTINQMSLALDELDIERFCLWTAIASVIAGLPVTLL